MSALPNIVDLDRLVALGGHAEFAGIVVVYGQDVRNLAILALLSLEKLFVSSQRLVPNSLE